VWSRRELRGVPATGAAPGALALQLPALMVRAEARSRRLRSEDEVSWWHR